jgi:c-di-GMP-binding flagellar brake protein YcgR
MVDIYNYLSESKKIEVIYKDKAGIPYQLSSQINKLTEDRILIAPPSVKGKVINIEDGTKIKIIICTEQGIFSGYSTVIGKKLYDEDMGLWISFPYNSQHCQRREYLRAPIHLEFELTIFKDKDRQEKIIKKYITKSLSGKGLNFISEDQLTDYYDIYCKILLNDNYNSPIESTCEHIYSKKTNIDGDHKYQHALAFSNISEHDIDRLVKICFKYQIEQRRNEKFYNS